MNISVRWQGLLFYFSFRQAWRIFTILVHRNCSDLPVSITMGKLLAWSFHMLLCVCYGSLIFFFRRKKLLALSFGSLLPLGFANYQIITKRLKTHFKNSRLLLCISQHILLSSSGIFKLQWVLVCFVFIIFLRVYNYTKPQYIFNNNF